MESERIGRRDATTIGREIIMMNLSAYKTHGRELAVFMNIPIQFLECVQFELRIKKSLDNLGHLRIRYRLTGSESTPISGIP